MSSPRPTSSGPSRRRNPHLPVPRQNGHSLAQLQADMTNGISQRSSNPDVSSNQDAMFLPVPAQPPHPYPTRLLPNPAKRKRYSVDDVTFQLDKVRVSKSQAARINIIPPPEGDGSPLPKTDYFTAYRRASDWDRHVDTSLFTTLPDDIQSSLRQTLSTRSVSSRKASDRIVRSLSTSPTVTNPASSSSSSPKPFDLISAISSTIEILSIVGSHLRPRDILTLYSISRPFHDTLDTHMRSSILVWANANCRLASEVFPHQFYVGGTVADPAGRPRDPAYHDIFARLSATPSLPDAMWEIGKGKDGEMAETRQVPSLRWLQMVYARQTRVRDIIASLARRGHRLPRGSDATLLKLWLVMDLPTNVDRCTVIREVGYFTRLDCYRAAVFLVKLLMRTNDPVYGPDHGALMELMLGQRGLSPLWKLLRGKEGFGTTRELVRAKLRYDVHPTVSEQKKGLPVLGVKVQEMGRGHLEGWGRGQVHLLRADELIARECARRGIEVDQCVESMVIYGHVDISKGEDLVPDLEELYMSDEDYPEELPPDEDGRRRRLVYGGGGNVPFHEGEWNPKLVRKARWEGLSEEMQKAIDEDDRDEMLRGLRWEEDSRGLSLEGSEEDEDAEMEEDEAPLALDVEGKGKMVDRKEPDVLDDDSVLGADSDDDFDISDDESVDPGFHGSRASSYHLPELSSRVVSSTSTFPVATPSPEGSPDIVGIHGDLHDMDDMDLDTENMDSTLMPSSLTATPLKFATSQMEGDSGSSSSEEEEEDSSGDEDGGDSDEELDDEERQRRAVERDEELLAQADLYYSEDELEYDWDAWKEQAGLVIGARDPDDSSSDEEEKQQGEEDKRGYHRLY